MIREFVIRLVVNTAAFALLERILPGIEVVARDTSNGEIVTLLIIAFIFGVINALVRPLLKLVSCAFILFTFGLFIFVIDAGLILLTAALSGGALRVESFWWALLAAVIMGVIGEVTERVFGLDEHARRR